MAQSNTRTQHHCWFSQWSCAHISASSYIIKLNSHWSPDSTPMLLAKVHSVLLLILQYIGTLSSFSLSLSPSCFLSHNLCYRLSQVHWEIYSQPKSKPLIKKKKKRQVSLCCSCFYGYKQNNKTSCWVSSVICSDRWSQAFRGEWWWQ